MSTEPVRFVHEDPRFVVVVKAGGFLAVPGRGPDKADCAAARVRARYPECPAYPAVHRLDMDTSGLMVFARDAGALRHLSRQFELGEPRKEYVAVLDGVPGGTGGEIRLSFRLDVDNRPLQVHDPVHGRLGITRWELLGVEDGRARVRFVPRTGRTHQLRVHAAHPLGLGTPIAGDPFYGNGTGPGQMLLHAGHLAFRHPDTEEELAFHSEPPF